MKIGNFSFEPVIEADDVPFPADGFFDARPVLEVDSSDRLLMEHYDRGAHALLLSHHAWLITTPAHKVIVDPCAGNHKPRPLLPPYHMLDLPWLERLAAAGAQPEDIDYVICTHLHADHCGWNTRLSGAKWVPTFPRAKYVFSRAEVDYWKQETAGALPKEVAYNKGVYTDSVAPVIDAGLSLIIEDSIRIGPFSVEPGPGHTPGHLKVIADTGGPSVVLAGDILHHPLQVANPGWDIRGSFSPADARRSRAEVLALCAQRGFLLAPAHFRSPYVFTVGRTGAGFSLSPWPKGA